MSKGKGKGSKFERDIAKYLTKWVSGKEKPYLYWRSPSSGGIGSFNNPDITGDIVALKGEAEFLTDMFSIEIKCGYPAFNFFKFFKKNSKSNELLKFWEQCKDDAIKGSKEPLLIYKQDRQPTIVIIGCDTFNMLSNNVETLNYFMVQTKSEGIYVFNMKEFFANITPNIVKGI